ncbi:hypothetical protein BGZ83_001667, partial [Gryganskiella cystojenkinii]
MHQAHQHLLNAFWSRQMYEIQNVVQDYKLHHLPLARIKKVMKTDDDVKAKMISSEVPMIFDKGCDIFITELTLRAWIHAEENKRRTLQRSDIAAAISKTDLFDFLIDIVPREEYKISLPKEHHKSAALFKHDPATNAARPPYTEGMGNNGRTGTGSLGRRSQDNLLNLPLPTSATGPRGPSGGIGLGGSGLLDPLEDFSLPQEIIVPSQGGGPIPPSSSSSSAAAAAAAATAGAPTSGLLESSFPYDIIGSAGGNEAETPFGL